jgi:nucleotidyltransferase substrate binding protein (TIGR01987 family)
MDKLTNFERTLKELGSYLNMPIVNNRDIAGIIQAFEFTFEQSWKTLQKIAGEQGVTLGNPRAAYSYALENGWITADSEPLWLQLLKDRNLTSHTYREDYAHEVLLRIQKNYFGMFTELLEALKKEKEKAAPHSDE